MLKPGLNIILDAQWGSCGKGKLAGYLGHHNPDYACASFGPNAGHTFIDGFGTPYMFKFLPTSAITAGCPVLILPDAVLDLATFFKECERVRGPVYVHPRASVLTPEDTERASQTGRHIAGTMRGTGHALARKMLRVEGVKLAKDLLPAHMLADTCEIVRNSCREGGTVIVEMAQGFDLSLNHGHDYPYLTSRDITVGAALNACGCPARYVGQVIGSLRTFPIRVGNVEGGWSGPCHFDQHELQWTDVTTIADAPMPLLEKTTVTGRTRRVFSFSMNQIKRFVEANDPAWLFVNFIQYLNWDVNEETDATRLAQCPAAYSFLQALMRETGVPVKLVGTGAGDQHMIKLG